jgi:hypothetical protein
MNRSSLFSNKQLRPIASVQELLAKRDVYRLPISYRDGSTGTVGPRTEPLFQKAFTAKPL